MNEDRGHWLSEWRVEVIGYVSEGEVIGYVGEGEVIGYVNEGEVIGYVSEGEVIGYVNEGEVIGYVNEGEVIGYVNEGEVIGYVSEGEVIGYVNEDRSHVSHSSLLTFVEQNFPAYFVESPKDEDKFPIWVYIIDYKVTLRTGLYTNIDLLTLKTVEIVHLHHLIIMQQV